MSATAPRSWLQLSARYALLVLLGCVALALGLFLAITIWISATASPYGTDSPHSGWSARWVPDQDGDGAADFVLATAFGPNGLDPRRRTISSLTGAALGIPPDSLGGEPRVQPGDLDGDGRPDAWWDDGLNLVVACSSTPERRVFACDLADLVDVLDDRDEDGWKDLVIGGYPRGSQETDRVSAVSLRTRSVIWTVERKAAEGPVQSWFAWVGGTVGDVDGDGAADVAVVDESERVEILSGRDGHTIGRSAAKCDGVSGALVPLDDLDGDDRPELLVHGGHDAPTVVVASTDGRVLRTLVRPRYVFDVFSPGDVDGDGLLDVAWSTGDDATCLRASDGSTIATWPGLRLMKGRADVDHDGHADLLGVRNVRITGDGPIPGDLWRRGRVEILSGRTLEPLHTYDADALRLPK